MPQRRAWTTQQDKTLKFLKQDLAITKWSTIAKKMADQYGMLDRTGKQCRQRYHNHLDSTILRTQWAQDQQQHLYRLHDEIGNKWAIIAQKLPGRTDNCVKNHFYSKMRKSIRKLNKIIYQYFKKQIKQIKMTVLYKIVQATDQRFKTTPNVQEDISDKCCKLKNVLLMYSNDGSQLEDDIPKLGQLAREIHQFSSKYRRKAKKTRRSSIQGTDLLKLPKFQCKIKSTTSQCDQDSQYSMVMSHSRDQQQQDQCQIDQQIPSNKKLYKIQQDLKQSINSIPGNNNTNNNLKFININTKINNNIKQPNQLTMPSINIIRPTLIKPPPLIKPPSMQQSILSSPTNFNNSINTNLNMNNTGIKMGNGGNTNMMNGNNNSFKNVKPFSSNINILESGDKVQQFLRNKGIVQNQIQSPLPMGHRNHMYINNNAIRPPNLKNNSLADSVQSIQSDHHNKNSVNFLSQSIEKMRIIDMSMNFDIEPDQENKLFISN